MLTRGLSTDGRRFAQIVASADPWNSPFTTLLSRMTIPGEVTMNADLIETRQQALDLLDAEMITFGMYVALCRFKGWQA